MNQQSNLCLDDQDGVTSSGANIQQTTCASSDTQYWQVSYAGNGLFTLINQHSGLALDDSGSGTNAGNKVWLYTSNGSGAQSWILQQQ